MSDKKDPTSSDRLSDKDIIFARQLAEVYLLIDNVSNFANKEIPRAPAESAQFKNAFGDGKDWLGLISAIPWPPHLPRDTDEQARNRMAERIMVARDLLNNAAAPANGLTIAFTQMVLNRPAIRLRDIPGWLLGLPGRAIGAVRHPHAQSDDDRDRQGRARPPHGTPPTTARSISCDIATGMLGNIAYPSLIRDARSFTTRVFFLVLFILIATIMTFALSWTVASGDGILANDIQARGTFEAARSAIADPHGPVHKATDGQPQDTPAAGSGHDPKAYCGKPPAAGAGDAIDYGLCDGLARATVARDSAELDLKRWNAHGLPWGLAPLAHLASLAPWTAPVVADPAGVGVSDGDGDVQWTAVWLQVMGGVVLPVLYGVIGAGAAAVRMLSAKMRDNTLTPRDSMLAWSHVGLGSLIGGCIGVFIVPDSTSAAHHLSYAALCFLAGFSVEGVFQMLERMAAAAFNTNGNTAPKPPAGKP
jgi:hypothetical protein